LAFAATNKFTDAAGRNLRKTENETDFKSTEVGKILDGYLAPLSAMSMDEATRLKVAVQMAKTKDNLNPGAVLSTFDKLKATLEAERETFNRSVASLDADISSSRARHQELQKQLADLSADMEGKIKLKTETANEFNAAADARTAELETEKQHYASLLQ
jgi:chromosome segregation ATPase